MTDADVRAYFSLSQYVTGAHRQKFSFQLHEVTKHNLVQLTNLSTQKVTYAKVSPSVTLWLMADEVILKGERNLLI